MEKPRLDADNYRHENRSGTTRQMTASNGPRIGSIRRRFSVHAKMNQFLLVLSEDFTDGNQLFIIHILGWEMELLDLPWHWFWP
jgi:hypothetical protein